METKKSIRQIIRKQRKELDPIIWQSQTAEICRKTCELDVFREATDIYCYIDFGGEVGTRPLMLEAWKLGKTVWVPKVHGETMDFYEITSFVSTQHRMMQCEKLRWYKMDPRWIIKITFIRR